MRGGREGISKTICGGGGGGGGDMMCVRGHGRRECVEGVLIMYREDVLLMY